ncbi:MAG: hypothetical protein H0W64_10800 [Gammaproteobacteria bacterium]|nr:hypothetical protein [Gammaproteobacteria bacterium]
MADDIDILLKETASSKKTLSLTTLLTLWYNDNRISDFIAFLRKIKDPLTDAEQLFLLKFILATAIHWDKGWFNYTNVMGKLFDLNYADSIAKQCLFKLLIYDEKVGRAMAVPILKDDFILDILITNKQQDLFLLLLTFAEENLFFNVCNRLINRKSWIEFATILIDRAPLFKFELPQVLRVAIANLNKPAPLTFFAPSFVVKENEMALFLKQTGCVNYESGCENLLAPRCQINPYSHYYDTQFSGSIHASEVAQLIHASAKQYFQGHFHIEKFNNKTMLLHLALEFKEELFAYDVAAAMHLTQELLAWLAIQNGCNEVLKLVLASSNKLNILFHQDDQNWLHHVARRGDEETLNLMISALGENVCNLLVNAKDRRGETPAFAIANQPTERLEAVLTIFLKLGAKFELKNKEGKYPAQSRCENTSLPARITIFKKLAIRNIPSLNNAILSKDITSLPEVIEEASLEALRSIFLYTSEEAIKVPILKPKPHLGGGMYWSEKRTLIERAIYEGFEEVIKCLVDKVLLNESNFTKQEQKNILKDILQYANDVYQLKFTDKDHQAIIDYFTNKLMDQTLVPSSRTLTMG